MKIFSIANALLSIAIGVMAVEAHAHTELSGSTPADQAVLDSAPAEVMLDFSEAVTLTAVALRSDTERRSLEIAQTAPALVFEIALPTLGRGDYVVEWRALSADTHVISGEIHFAVTP